MATTAVPAVLAHPGTCRIATNSVYALSSAALGVHAAELTTTEKQASSLKIACGETNAFIIGIGVVGDITTYTVGTALLFWYGASST